MEEDLPRLWSKSRQRKDNAIIFQQSLIGTSLILLTWAPRLLPHPLNDGPSSDAHRQELLTLAHPASQQHRRKALEAAAKILTRISDILTSPEEIIPYTSARPITFLRRGDEKTSDSSFFP